MEGRDARYELLGTISPQKSRAGLIRKLGCNEQPSIQSMGQQRGLGAWDAASRRHGSTAEESRREEPAFHPAHRRAPHCIEVHSHTAPQSTAARPASCLTTMAWSKGKESDKRGWRWTSELGGIGGASWELGGENGHGLGRTGLIDMNAVSICVRECAFAVGSVCVICTYQHTASRLTHRSQHQLHRRSDTEKTLERLIGLPRVQTRRDCGTGASAGREPPAASRSEYLPTRRTSSDPLATAVDMHRHMLLIVGQWVGRDLAEAWLATGARSPRLAHLATSRSRLALWATRVLAARPHADFAQRLAQLVGAAAQ